VLELVGLARRGRERVATYSGGMKRRLNLACGVIHRPRLLFLDEPTVGVDPQSRNWIFDNIESLRRGGTTVLYTTHYMEEAERLCDQVAIMDRGRLIAQGTVAELVAAHGGASIMAAELEGGESFRRETENPLEDLASLVQEGRRLLRLKVDRPGLEKVFLNLTGRSLRDL